MARAVPLPGRREARLVVFQLSKQVVDAIVRADLGLQPGDLPFRLAHVGMIRTVAGPQARQIGLQRLQPVLGTENSLPGLAEHLRRWTHLRELRLQQYLLRIKRADPVACIAQVEFGPVEQLEVRLRELRQGRDVLLLERGQLLGERLILTREPVGLLVQEAFGLLRDLRARADVLIEVERGQFVRDLECDVG